jgi:tetratricopeptide (TPR) repeat protein
VSTLFICLLGAVLSSNPPVATTASPNPAPFGEGGTAESPAVREQALKKLEADDDAALEEIDRWIKENQALGEAGAATPNTELNDRIRRRLQVVRDAYEAFIKRYPKDDEGRLAYASSLHDTGEEEAALVHLETARELNPRNPAVWNNLANHYGHTGGVTNAFAAYEKAIALDPNEPVYYHNFGTTVYLFRKDAREFYGIAEAQVFDKALMLYSNSVRLDPTNFLLAADFAQSYYGIRPLRTNDALHCWTNAMKVATTDSERQGVHLHLARIKNSVGRFDEARAHLSAVTNAEHREVKDRLTRNVNERQFGTNALTQLEGTNAAASTTPTNAPAKP